MNSWAGTAYGLSQLGRDLSTGNILDVAESVRGDYLPYEGMSSPAVTRDCPNRGRDLSANSSAATPLYLLASEIVDIVEFSEQLRLEEEDAAEEGAAIEASNLPYPEYERNGR